MTGAARTSAAFRLLRDGGGFGAHIVAVRQALKSKTEITEIGVRANHNLTLGVANAVAGIEAGAARNWPSSQESRSTKRKLIAACTRCSVAIRAAASRRLRAKPNWQ